MDVIEVLKTEKACVERQPNCDRDCANCDLVLEAEDVIRAYEIAISVIENLKGVLEELCPDQNVLPF